MTPVIENYSTHQPLLTAAVVSTTGAVVELGAGFYSTPLLQSLCVSQNRKLWTFENNSEWMLKFLPKDGSNPHPHCFSLLDSWSDLERFGEDLKCDVAFIDVDPASERGHLINVMRRWAKIIVVHDVETEQHHNYPGVEDALSSFKFRVEDRRRGAWTAVVSDMDINYLKRSIL